jgi:hypothetical protein
MHHYKGIVEVKNSLLEEAKKLDQDEEQIERSFYEVMRVKNNLEA